MPPSSTDRPTLRLIDSILPKKESPESPNKIDGMDALLEANAARLRAPAEKPKFQAFILGRKA